MLKALKDEVQNGCPNLGGSHLQGTIPISKSLLKNLLSAKGITLEEIGSDNTALLKWKKIPVLVEIVRIDLDPLTVVTRVKLGGLLKVLRTEALIAKMVAFFEDLSESLRGHVRAGNGLIFVELESYPAVAAFRSYWRLVTQITARSKPSSILLDFKAQVR